ncbi:MAG: NHL repeat-containing protein [Candidatus Binataceae bacterium]
MTAYAAGTSGYGSTATPLGTDTTDSAGNFKIPKFSCPTTQSQIYLVATGGTVNGNANSAVTFMTAVGACGQLAFSGGVFSTDLDELTTVASAYALSQFMNPSNPSQIGASSTNSIGIANVAATVPNLANFVDGTPAAFLSTGNNSPATLDSLANILAACVQSSGATSAQCTTLNSSVQPPPPAPAATNTLMAALDMARNPVFNAAKLFGLQTENPPYQPALASAPAAWTLGLNYIGGGLIQPYGIAIDSNGNVWTANQGNNSVSQFSPTGTAISPATGYTGNGLNFPIGIAIDPNNNVWVANNSGNSISEFNPKGTAATGSPFTGNGLNGPQGIAFDVAGNAWVANVNGNSLSEFNFSGAPVGGSPFTGNGLTNPTSPAIDGAGNVWVAGNGIFSEFNSIGAPVGGSPFFGGGLISPKGVAIDAQGNAWANNTGSKGIGGISKFSSTGTALSPAPSGFTGGGQDGTGIGIAIDSLGNAWSTNSGSSSASETNSAGAPISPSTGFTGSALSAPHGIAIDAGGDVWVANFGGNSITEFIGTASPVLTALSACLRTQHVAVCKP